MNIGNKSKHNCSGCTVCALMCPHKAITMAPDKLGFFYPVINYDCCTDCGLCTKICQFSVNYKTLDIYNTPVVYGARVKDNKLLSSCQSGGIATVLSTSFVRNGGVIYGVCFDENFHVIHDRADNIEEIAKFRGSKYVQSDLRDSFKRVKDDLVSGKNVLFIGTACQVAGLKAYIPVRLQEHLFVVDILCHASPSPALWDSYIQYIKEKEKADIVSVNMRDKSYGWRSFHETYELSDGRRIKKDSYIYLFFKHLSIRKSCEECPFTNHKRVGDITISDFWGWSTFHPEWNDNKGISMIMINSDKGKVLFDSIKEDILFIESNENEIDTLQPQLSRPSSPNPLRDLFEEDYYEKGFYYVSKKYGDDNWKEHLKKILRPIYNLIRN